MKRPDPKLIFTGCSDVVQDYIKHLECEVIHLNAIRNLFVIHESCSPVDRVLELINENMLLKSVNHNVTEQDHAEQCSAEWAIKQREQLDQFAMAALTVAHEQVQELSAATLIRIIGKENLTLPITGEDVRQAVAITAYMMAEAMQAESQKRQGGAV